MADVIRVLPDSVANQIAAGEVVQRPASVVKELIENAVDAGSTSITVNIQEGGRGMIQVIDNGCGLSSRDAKLAFERHATSKITQADDLYALSTFGFRGEALASIASVSETELRTKRAEDEVGLRLSVNGGTFGDSSPVNIPCGSQLIVKNLFYNVPARRKFLKSKSVETRHIVDEFLRVALCNPQIEMNLYDDDTARYKLPLSNRRQRIVNLFGKHINANLLDLSVQTSIISIEGFIGTPQSAKKSGAGEQFLFVNNRYFKCPYFHKAIMQAYEKLIQPNVYPPYFLYMTIDPTRIDVNIHPTKTEIKFEDEQAIWQIINAAVRESLGKLGAVPLMDFDSEESIEIPVFRGSDTDFKEPVSSLNPDFNPFAGDSSRPSSPKTVSSGRRSGGYLRNMRYTSEGVPEGWEVLYKESYDSFDHSSLDGDSFRNFILGDNEEADADEVVSAGFDSEATDMENTLHEQGVLEIESELAPSLPLLKLSHRYVAIAREQNLVLIDLNRAHHRILYERFLQKEATDFSINQQELFPEPVSVSAEEARLLREVLPDLLKMGFDLEAAGQEQFLLKGIPADLEAVQARELVDTLLCDLKEHGVPVAENRRKELARTVADACCLQRSRALQEEEIQELILSLYDCKEPAFTADGRAILSVITANDIKKRFR